MHRINALLVAALFTIGSGEKVMSQTFQTIYTVPDPGSRPVTGLVELPGGAFLGTASQGGLADFGTIFEFTPGNAPIRRANFTGENGYSPDGILVLGTDGKYYGTTPAGGKGDRGVAYRVSATGVLEKLADFSTILSADPTYPTGRLARGADGNFYGTCSSYSQSSPGSIYKLTPANKLVIVAKFDGTNGRYPSDGLVSLDDSTFLGVATDGGTDDFGVVYKVTTGGAITRLTDFTGPNGKHPVGALVKGADGNFYGTTQTGGASDAGTVFKVTPAGVVTPVASFDPPNGHTPQGAMVEISGTFYGMTKFGGANNEGVVFKVTPGDNTPAISKIADLGETVGRNAWGGLIVKNGMLYGTTSYGGASDAGTIIEVTTTGTLTKVADMGSSNGKGLAGGVISGPGGLLYGAATFDGTKGAGTLFSLSTAGAFTKLTDFDGKGLGGAPIKGLTLGHDDKIYGISHGDHLFSATAAGVIENLGNFNSVAGIHGANEIVQLDDDSFYGTASGNSGNSGNDKGSIYRYNPGGSIESVYRFTPPTNTYTPPTGRLAEGPDGALYGVTRFGGANNLGSVFRVTKGGFFKTIASFSSSTGSQPTGSLVLGRDGNFYGLCNAGGTYRNGTVFRVSPQGKLSRIAAFTGFNGAYPRGGLILGPGGHFFGTTFAGGGIGKVGTVFKVTPSGAITMLAAFDGQTNGAYPLSTLCQGPDGNLYGTTLSTAFQLVFPPNTPPVAQNETFTLPMVRKNVLSNDSDANKDPLFIASATDGLHGTVEFTEDGMMTYFPNPDFDSDTVTTDSFTYTISDGRGGTATGTVTVNVPDNLLRAGAGVYGGTLALNNAAEGYWAITTNGVGAFTGALYLDGVKTSIKGIFGSDGSFTKAVTRKTPLAPLVINLQLNTLDNSITGTVTAGLNTYEVVLIRKLPVYSAKAPTPRTGKYTALISPAAVSPNIPAGTGFGKMTVSTKGAVVIVGKLGDGEPFAVGSFLTSDEEVPIYAPAYPKDKGYLAGLLAFGDQPDSEITGALSWKKPARDTDLLYPLGFNTTALFRGTRYLGGSPVLPLAPVSPNAVLNFGLADTKSLNITTKNVVSVVVPVGDATKVKIDAASGIFTGTYMDAGIRRAFGGVIFQGVDGARGQGFFLKATSTDTVLLEPAD